ncbi:hypothetical protein NQ315_017144 [Exocentrus adspersus]|uniref:Uncharacterized protein n=1 Tax=Exocentrus adspersus TaxID=1586481 RepID=A0AAV8VCF8_9CUCU|nr:hypothetical protein NQ315_017144 [Exocentrus adspersus]
MHFITRSPWGNRNEAQIKSKTRLQNSTPHRTTGKSPSELLHGRNIRDKIPGLEEILNIPVDEETRDLDLINKEKGRIREDEQRKSRKDCIQIGDRLYVKNVTFPHKLTTDFGNTPYCVTKRNGNKALLESEGRIARRHVSHIKKIPTHTATASHDNKFHSPPPSTVTQPDNEVLREPSSVTDGPDKEVMSASPTAASVEPLRLRRKEGMWRPVTD